jgi:hypothetical protein
VPAIIEQRDVGAARGARANWSAASCIADWSKSVSATTSNPDRFSEAATSAASLAGFASVGTFL